MFYNTNNQTLFTLHSSLSIQLAISGAGSFLTASRAPHLTDQMLTATATATTLTTATIKTDKNEDEVVNVC